MHQAFSLLPQNIIPSQTNFFAEVSDDCVSFFYQDTADKKITGLSVYNFEKKKSADSVSALLKTLQPQIQQEGFNKTVIAYSFIEVILAPGAHYKEDRNKTNLELIYGDLLPSAIFTDTLTEQNIHAIYRIPANIHNEISSTFTNASFIHQYSLLIKQMGSAGNLLKVIFYYNKMVIALQKEGKLQIIQSFKYITAEDVIYHLLSVCDKFNVKDVQVALSGMIEKDSALFKAIEKYFLKVSFASMPDELIYTDAVKEYPAHYFSHLFSIALCA